MKDQFNDTRGERERERGRERERERDRERDRERERAINLEGSLRIVWSSCYNYFVPFQNDQLSISYIMMTLSVTGKYYF